MSFFHPTEPIIRSKQNHLDIQDLKGLLKINLKFGNITLLSSFYTRIDQVFLLWGWISLIIFAIAQFLPISWITQAYWWSILTIVGTIGMMALSYYWVQVERLTWMVYWWVALMVLGLGLTNLGIFWGWSEILMNLCPLWLGLCALGYLGTGIGLHSRAFLIAGFIHFWGIFLLPYFIGWQFLISGLILGGTLLFFAEVQWDMRSQIESYLLTAEEMAFNQEQHQRRQIQSL
ncbi:hypothetical protein H6G57_12870 [Planktothrix sp. FACHB-1365]|nr:hypothetical protein [Planktothrix sp. FACHB-1365]